MAKRDNAARGLEGKLIELQKNLKNKIDNRWSIELKLLLNLKISKDMSGIKFYYMWLQFYLVGTF